MGNIKKRRGIMKETSVALEDGLLEKIDFILKQKQITVELGLTTRSSFIRNATWRLVKQILEHYFSVKENE